MAEVNRERVLLLGGQRALLMQIAHPQVAAGVAEHSDFPARALQRLRRTLDLSLSLIYGTPAEADRAAGAIRAVHDRVSGEAGGAPYSANDPHLLLWVNATLVDTTLLVYERFVRPLDPDDRRRYYAESVEAAELFGIPRERIPPTLAGFERYVHDVLSGDELQATDHGRRLARHILRPPLALPLRLPTAVVRTLTVAMLPERVRELFGLRAGAGAHAALRAGAAVSRRVVPWLPPVIREFARARVARGERGEYAA